MITVLFVDDSAMMRQMVCHTLESSRQYRCIVAANGEEGLHALSSAKPELIITDLNMPHMNGLEFLSSVRALPDHRFTPVLLLTTESTDALRQDAKQRGATGWMVKPFNPEKLLRTLEKVTSATSS